MWFINVDVCSVSFCSVCSQDAYSHCVGTGLQETYCVEKMRQLTLVSLAMEAQEIPFSRLSQELHMETDQLEQFVINGEKFACCVYVTCVCVWGGGMRVCVCVCE